MEKKNNDYPTIRELTYRNAEKIDLMLEEIKEIKQKMDCLISIKQDLAKHKAYFKVMGGGDRHSHYYKRNKRHNATCGIIHRHKCNNHRGRGV